MKLRARSHPAPRWSWTLVLLTIVLGSCGGGHQPTAGGNGTPVIILAVDTLRGDFLHCAGMDWIRTPNMDALAGDAVYFRDCMATAPWTGPSFASIFTGLLPYHHGYVGSVHGRLGDDKTTIAEILRDAGYDTGGYVTISYLTGFCGMNQGFLEGDKFTDDATGASGRWVVDQARQFLGRREADPRPWFLFLHWYDVHAPYTPPAPFDGMYYHGDPKAPGEPIVDFLRSDKNFMAQQRDKIYNWLEGVTDYEYPIRQYAAGVSYVDSLIGEVVGDLKAQGLYDDACIILVGDHGDHLGEHGLFYTHLFPYREVVHVPLMIKWPGGRFGGRVIDDKVSTLDILPTLMDILEMPPRLGLDGRSLLPLARGDGPGEPRLLVAEQGSNPDFFVKALVDGPWKLMLHRIDGKDHPVLYDLRTDPDELHDVHAEHPDVTERLTAEVWRLFDPAEPVTKQAPLLPRGVSEAERQRLKSLGYLN